MWRVLLVHLTPIPRAVRLTIRHHLDALEEMPGADWVLPYNAVHGVPRWLGRLDFDAVVLHTTFLGQRWNIWFEQWKGHTAWLADLDCLKIALPQDEYHHAETLDRWLDELGVSVVGTVLDATHRDELYPRMSSKAAFYELLTGYIDDESAARVAPKLKPPEERDFDIVYRARNLPYWLGSHGQLKHRVGEAAAERCAARGLRCDISTRPQQTILGDAWLEFLGTGRATIGAESGASALDREGEMQRLNNELLAANPELTFEQFAAQMPAGWDDYRFFALSPRHLEAVVTKTAQILVEGSYSGVLTAGEHYIPVRRDLSDLDDALEAARDRSLLAEIADRAYTDIYESGRYSSRRLTDTLERMLAEHARPRERRRPSAHLKLVERAAGVSGLVGRTLLEPAANVMRVGSGGHPELLAGLRLVASDSRVRRLLMEYLRSTETRKHVSPRVALSDLLALGAIRRARAGKFDGRPRFRVSARIDRDRRRVVISSRAGDGNDGRDATPSPEAFADLLREQGWEFLWDHSGVATSASYPLLLNRAVELSLQAGPSSLGVLNWLARYHPDDVAAALAPLLSSPRD